MPELKFKAWEPPKPKERKENMPVPVQPSHESRTKPSWIQRSSFSQIEMPNHLIGMPDHETFAQIESSDIDLMSMFGQANAISNNGFVHDGHEIFSTQPPASSLASVYHFMGDAVNGTIVERTDQSSLDSTNSDQNPESPDTPISSPECVNKDAASSNDGSNMVQPSGNALINPCPQGLMLAQLKNISPPPIEQQFGDNSDNGNPSLNCRPRVASVGEAAQVRQCGENTDHNEHREPYTIKSYKAPASVTGPLEAPVILQRSLSEDSTFSFRAETAPNSGMERHSSKNIYLTTSPSSSVTTELNNTPGQITKRLRKVDDLISETREAKRARRQNEMKPSEPSLCNSGSTASLRRLPTRMSGTFSYIKSPVQVSHSPRTQNRPSKNRHSKAGSSASQENVQVQPPVNQQTSTTNSVASAKTNAARQIPSSKIHGLNQQDNLNSSDPDQTQPHDLIPGEGKFHYTAQLSSKPNCSAVARPPPLGASCENCGTSVEQVLQLCDSMQQLLGYIRDDAARRMAQERPAMHQDSFHNAMARGYCLRTNNMEACGGRGNTDSGCAIDGESGNSMGDTSSIYNANQCSEDDGVVSNHLRWEPLEEARLNAWVKEGMEWLWIAGKLDRTKEDVLQHWEWKAKKAKMPVTKGKKRGGPKTERQAAITKLAKTDFVKTKRGRGRPRKVQ